MKLVLDPLTVDTPAPENTPTPSLTVKEAAKALGKDVTTIHRYIRKGLLPARREATPFGPVYFLDAEAVARFTPPALGNPNIAQVRADTLARKASGH